MMDFEGAIAKLKEYIDEFFAFIKAMIAKITGIEDPEEE